MMFLFRTLKLKLLVEFLLTRTPHIIFLLISKTFSKNIISLVLEDLKNGELITMYTFLLSKIEVG